MLAYLKLEVTRTLRNRRFLVFVVGFPIGFYILFTQIFAGQMSAADRVVFFREYMISMAAYGAMGSALMSTGPRIAMERASGWNQQLRLTPLTPGGALAAKAISAMLTGLVSPIVVTVTGRLVNHVSLPPATWLGTVLLLWVCTVPFALLGVAIGYLVDGETAQMATMVVYLLLAVLGGIWVPIDQFPDTMRAIGQALPSYRFIHVGSALVDGRSIDLADVGILLAYAAAFAALGLFAYRRPTDRVRTA